MAVLEQTLRRHIAFDPGNPSHRAVYWQLRTSGRQDPELRFVLEEGFHSVITMMQCKIADHYSKPVEAKAPAGAVLWRAQL